MAMPSRVSFIFKQLHKILYGAASEAMCGSGNFPHSILSYPGPGLSLESRYLLKVLVSVPFLCSIEAQKVDQLAISLPVTCVGVTCPIGINPRPASASRALLRLIPCHRSYRSPSLWRAFGYYRLP